MNVTTLIDPAKMANKMATKNIKNKFKKIDKIPVSINDNCIAKIQSSSNTNITYQISLKNDRSSGIFLECNCGNQFGVNPRRNCKHIASFIHSCTTSFFQSQIESCKSYKISSGKKRKKCDNSVDKDEQNITDVIDAFEHLFC